MKLFAIISSNELQLVFLVFVYFSEQNVWIQKQHYETCNKTRNDHCN